MLQEKIILLDDINLKMLIFYSSGNVADFRNGIFAGCNSIRNYICLFESSVVNKDMSEFLLQVVFWTALVD